MLSRVSDSQKKIIRELVDQLIVNRGILPAQEIAYGIDHSQLLELSRLAFRYYKMIYTGASPLDIDLNANKGRGLAEITQPEFRACLGCGEGLDDDNSMPVCQNCRNQLKADYDVLKSLLD
jgi:hypothetical protein